MAPSVDATDTPRPHTTLHSPVAFLGAFQMSRIITVFGATGAQGGGLARSILTDPQQRFRVRAVTRKPDSPAARALSEIGADIIVADLDDAASVRRAMDGAHGAFCVTNFWEHLSPEKELTQAHTMAQAA